MLRSKRNPNCVFTCVWKPNKDGHTHKHTRARLRDMILELVAKGGCALKPRQKDELKEWKKTDEKQAEAGRQTNRQTELRQ